MIGRSGVAKVVPRRGQETLVEGFAKWFDPGSARVSRGGPMARSERDELEEAALPAVLVRRTDLPVPLAHPARSFFGGLPRLPPQLEWPVAEVTANETPETVALTFVAQIDLAEVPGSGWSPLPKRGTLFRCEVMLPSSIGTPTSAVCFIFGLTGMHSRNSTFRALPPHMNVTSAMRVANWRLPDLLV